MNRISIGALISVAALTAGCVTAGPQIPAVGYEEAKAYERSLQVHSKPMAKKPDQQYVQPINKKESCKLPTSAGQLARNNFRAFWDGQCKNGFAFGLGRDIAISDTHHYEEITIYGEEGKKDNSPSVFYDFVQTRVRYSHSDDEYPNGTNLYEYITNDPSKFFVSYELQTIRGSKEELVLNGSPLHPARFFTYRAGNVIYKFSDYSNAPVTKADQVLFTAETIDPSTMTPGGFVIVRFANGIVRHIRLNNGNRDVVSLPAEYLNELSEKQQAVNNSQAIANAKVERARQMEREYLHMACNGRHSIDGLDKETYTKLCTWREQFKEPYEKATARYKQEMAELQQKADSVAKELQAQQKLALERQRLAQQQTQQGIGDFFSALGQMGQQMQNTAQQTTPMFITPTPQVTPWAPPGSNRINCITTGNITSCR